VKITVFDTNSPHLILVNKMEFVKEEHDIDWGSPHYVFPFFLTKVLLGRSTTNYLQNRCPTKIILENRSPYEVWTGISPIVTHLKIFGCTAYALIS